MPSNLRRTWPVKSPSQGSCNHEAFVIEGVCSRNKYGGIHSPRNTVARARCQTAEEGTGTRRHNNYLTSSAAVQAVHAQKPQKFEVYATTQTDLTLPSCSSDVPVCAYRNPLKFVNVDTLCPVKSNSAPICRRNVSFSKGLPLTPLDPQSIKLPPCDLFSRKCQTDVLNTCNDYFKKKREPSCDRMICTNDPDLDELNNGDDDDDSTSLDKVEATDSIDTISNNINWCCPSTKNKLPLPCPQLVDSSCGCSEEKDDSDSTCDSSRSEGSGRRKFDLDSTRVPCPGKRDICPKNYIPRNKQKNRCKTRLCGGLDYSDANRKYCRRKCNNNTHLDFDSLEESIEKPKRFKCKTEGLNTSDSECSSICNPRMMKTCQQIAKLKKNSSTESFEIEDRPCKPCEPCKPCKPYKSLKCKRKVKKRVGSGDDEMRPKRGCNYQNKCKGPGCEEADDACIKSCKIRKFGFKMPSKKHRKCCLPISNSDDTDLSDGCKMKKKCSKSKCCKSDNGSVNLDCCKKCCPSKLSVSKGKKLKKKLSRERREIKVEPEVKEKPKRKPKEESYEDDVTSYDSGEKKKEKVQKPKPKVSDKPDNKIVPEEEPKKEKHNPPVEKIKPNPIVEEKSSEDSDDEPIPEIKKMLSEERIDTNNQVNEPILKKKKRKPKPIENPIVVPDDSDDKKDPEVKEKLSDEPIDTSNEVIEPVVKKKKRKPKPIENPIVVSDDSDDKKVPEVKKKLSDEHIDTNNEVIEPIVKKKRRKPKPIDNPIVVSDDSDDKKVPEVKKKLNKRENEQIVEQVLERKRGPVEKFYVDEDPEFGTKEKLYDNNVKEKLYEKKKTKKKKPKKPEKVISDNEVVKKKPSKSKKEKEIKDRPSIISSGSGGKRTACCECSEKRRKREKCQRTRAPIFDSDCDCSDDDTVSSCECCRGGRSQKCKTRKRKLQELASQTISLCSCSDGIEPRRKRSRDKRKFRNSSMSSVETCRDNRRRNCRDRKKLFRRSDSQSSCFDTEDECCRKKKKRKICPRRSVLYSDYIDPYFDRIKRKTKRKTRKRPYGSTTSCEDCVPPRRFEDLMIMKPCGGRCEEVLMRPRNSCSSTCVGGTSCKKKGGKGEPSERRVISTCSPNSLISIAIRRRQRSVSDEEAEVDSTTYERPPRPLILNPPLVAKASKGIQVSCVCPTPGPPPVTGPRLIRRICRIMSKGMQAAPRCSCPSPGHPGTAFTTMHMTPVTPNYIFQRHSSFSKVMKNTDTSTGSSQTRIHPDSCTCRICQFFDTLHYREYNT